ncbi:MAG: vWA domain-containing protein, partial [Anaerolineaceae bacterium]|nr:vWA domain-containing protein [Anaerolineaceae bacterium]
SSLGELTELSQSRDSMARRVSGLVEGGGTRLFDAVQFAYDDLQQKGDPDHIRAIVVLSDGMDTESSQTLDKTLSLLNGGSEEGGNSIKLFTISYGEDADQDTLSSLSDITGASMFKADPKTIDEIYKQIATFF